VTARVFQSNESRTLGILIVPAILGRALYEGTIELEEALAFTREPARVPVPGSS
jgi:hypothetical protein